MEDVEEPQAIGDGARGSEVRGIDKQKGGELARPSYG